MKPTETKTPASRVIAEPVEEERSTGHYDEERKTWSHRAYELASTKKHNEQH